MKILLISNMYPSEKAPNYGVFVKNTEQILTESGYNVERIVMHKQSRGYKKFFSYLVYYLAIIHKSMFISYDILYVHYASHNALPLLFVKHFKRNAKIYINVHGSDVIPESKFSERLQNLVKKLVTVSDKVIVPSKYYRDLVCKKYGINEDKIKVFPSGGINENVFYKVPDKCGLLEKIGLKGHLKYIGYVGRIDYKKGWDVLLKTIKLMKSDNSIEGKRFIIVGNGKELELFKKMIEEYDIKEYIIYFNMLPQNRLNEIYNCLDLFCFPTMREGESLGLVGLEAMACGVPVIGSQMAGLLDYIKDGGNGFFFEPGNSSILKNKINDYFNLPEVQRELMRINALETSKKYRVNNVRKNLLEIFCRK